MDRNICHYFFRSFLHNIFYCEMRQICQIKLLFFEITLYSPNFVLKSLILSDFHSIAINWCLWAFILYKVFLNHELLYIFRKSWNKLFDLNFWCHKFLLGGLQKMLKIAATKKQHRRVLVCGDVSERQFQKDS